MALTPLPSSVEGEKIFEPTTLSLWVANQDDRTESHALAKKTSKWLDSKRVALTNYKQLWIKNKL
jgi:hypothetical protein